jgi:hypothetical protein
MKQTLLVSVAALALAAGSTVALSQGGPGGGSPGGAAGGANAPMANPSGPGGGAGGLPGGSMSKDSQSTIDGKQQRGAQERGGDRMQKQDRMQKSTEGKDQPATQQRQTQSPAQQRQGQTQQQDTQTGTKSQVQQNGTGTKGQAQTGTQGGTKGAMTTSNVSLTSEQKTVIRSKVLTGSAPRVTNVNFDIRVGTVVPRTVRVAPVPVTLVEIEPRWRGYMYFVYSDEIIIVEPRTLKIVAVLEV